MSSHKLSFLLMLVCACAHAPSGYLPAPGRPQPQGKGSWIKLTTTDNVHLHGELLAVEGGCLYLQVPGKQPITQRQEEVDRAKLFIYSAERPAMILALVTFVAIPTTIRLNGFVAIFTAPAWLITGAASILWEVSRSRLRYNTGLNPPLAGFQRYSRFPQGMPRAYYEKHFAGSGCEPPGEPSSTPSTIPATAPASLPEGQGMGNREWGGRIGVPTRRDRTEMSDHSIPAEEGTIVGALLVGALKNIEEQRWGETDAYKESKKRTAHYTKQDWHTIKAKGDSINQQLATLLRVGVASNSTAAMDVAEEHRLYIERWFYQCPKVRHRGLGEMYINDPRFTASFEKIKKGLAQYVCEAFVANATRL